jgi:hypothetical protein
MKGVMISHVRRKERKKPHEMLMFFGIVRNRKKGLLYMMTSLVTSLRRSL